MNLINVGMIDLKSTTLPEYLPKNMRRIDTLGKRAVLEKEE